MEMLLVENSMPRPVGYTVTVPGPIPVLTTRVLKPGRNEVPADEFELATGKNKVWQEWIGSRLIVVTSKRAEAGLTLSTLSPDEAKRSIADTFDRELIAAWIDNETRPEVKKALRKRDEFRLAEYKRRDVVKAGE